VVPAYLIFEKTGGERLTKHGGREKKYSNQESNPSIPSEEKNQERVQKGQLKLAESERSIKL